MNHTFSYNSLAYSYIRIYAHICNIYLPNILFAMAL